MASKEAMALNALTAFSPDMRQRVIDDVARTIHDNHLAQDVTDKMVIGYILRFCAQDPVPGVYFLYRLRDRQKTRLVNTIRTAVELLETL